MPKGYSISANYGQNADDNSFITPRKLKKHEEVAAIVPYNTEGKDFIPINNVFGQEKVLRKDEAGCHGF